MSREKEDKMVKVDPRIVRTKQMFQEALISLLKDKKNDRKLTVQKISDRAGLNRATFYLHYQDLRDFIEQMNKEVLDEMYRTIIPPSAEMTPVVSGRFRLVSFLEYIQKRAVLFELMLESKKFRNKVFRILIDVLAQWEEERERNGQSFKVPLDILAASTLGIVSWWLQEGMPYSTNYLAEHIIRMA